MKIRPSGMAGLCLGATLVWALGVVPVFAQVFTGRIEVTVVDSTGAVLPGATVDIAGPRDLSRATDARGVAVFLNLPPGTYTVDVALEGFGKFNNPNVPVTAGLSVPIKAVLAVGGVTQEVEVSAETPVVDPKKLTTSTNVTNDELQLVPSSRDPWVVLQTVPGVIVDRVNVGGAESGQQSSYQAKGAARGDNTWNMDGVPITDMAALGSSPTYYDFDMFQEMQVTTGGADLSSPTPGVALNFVLKGGSNTPHGSTRFYFENEDMQSNNMPEDLKASLGGATGKGNRIKEYKDYGFELGGPIWKDRLWAWGAYGKTDVTLLTLSNTPDRTVLDNRSFKATGQVNPAIRGSYTYFRGDKNKWGRGASPTVEPAATFDQTGPTPVHKFEGNFVVRNNLFVTGRYAYVGGGFHLAPQGGLDKQWFVDDAGITRGSRYDYLTTRPQWSAAGDGSYFFGKNEVKFGFGWRRADVDSTTLVPGNGIISYHDGYPRMIAEVTAWNENVSARGEYSYAFVGDTITLDRFTFNLGVRWDRQAGSVKGFTQHGNPTLPELLPDLTGQPANDVVVWNSFAPRIGVSYALDENRKTLARASYGMFASQLGNTAGNFLSAVQYRGIYYYDVIDSNGNNYVDASELEGLEPTDWYGLDINNPAALETANSVGDYSTPMTHEIQFGLDHELMPNFGFSGTFTWRHFNNFVWRNNGVVGTDYEQIGTYDGSDPQVGTYSVPIYGATRIPENRSATEYRKRPDYHQRFWGVELAATKRLSNRWMARLGFSTNFHREYFDSMAGRLDPTPTPANPNKDGGFVMIQDTSSGKTGIYQVMPQYQIIATGLYQARWGINLAANMVTRQGYSMPYFRSQVATADPLQRNKSMLLVDDVGDYRLPTLTSLDVRFGKEFVFYERYRVNFDVDVFNLLNSATVLRRQYDLRVSTADNVLEIMNPRVLRLGLRFNF